MSMRRKNAARTRRGQPLIMLAVVLSVWTGARIAMWETPWSTIGGLSELAAPKLAAREIPPPPTIIAAEFPQQADAGLVGQNASPRAGDAIRGPRATPPLQWSQLAAPPPQGSDRAEAGQQMLWLAAMARLHLPSEFEPQLEQVARPGETATLARNRDYPHTGRWSLDSWALWREGSGSALVSQGRVPTYGASQAGAVLRYSLAPGSGRDPQAYARAYRALISGGESELATGLSARPLAPVPLRVHAELRVTEFSQSTELRPAAFVTTELPVIRLPAGLRAEAYLQAGYVAGEAATPFVDGQAHVLRGVYRFDLGQLSLGAAAWGGAQEGAGRLDLGPSVRLDMTIGETPARISLDYRGRIAGDAEPPSGMALTVSTRF